MGATIPGLCWDTYGRKPGFSRDQPWLFRAFDQIIFHEVSREEFDDIVQHFRREQYEIKIEPAHFDMTAYSRLMKEVGSELESLRALRQKCTQIELEAEAKLYEEWEVSRQKASEVTIGEDENLIKVSIGTTSNVWKLNVQEGDIVKQGDVVVVLEAMKMEITLRSPAAGKVEAVLKNPGDLAEAGDTIMLLR